MIEMDIRDLKEVLESVGIPVVYHSFQSSGLKVQPPPYIVYLIKSSDNIGADDKVYQKQYIVHIELYSKQKNIKLEQKLEDALDKASIFYDKTELYIEEEKMFEILYEIKI